MSDLEDKEFVLRTLAGETEAFGFLVEKYESKIKRYARKFLYGYEDIEDNVQKVFIKAYINIRSFDVSRKFSTWLYRIAHNEFINAIKKKKKESISFLDPDTIFPHLISKDDADMLFKIKELEDFLPKLNPKYREIIVLYFFEELSYKEISDVIHIPVSTVGVRLRRAKKELKKLYGRI
jgi:RNA polymerase sigma-70 factor, ECF subfamily